MVLLLWILRVSISGRIKRQEGNAADDDMPSPILQRVEEPVRALATAPYT